MFIFLIAQQRTHWILSQIQFFLYFLKKKSFSDVSLFRNTFLFIINPEEETVLSKGWMSFILLTYVECLWTVFSLELVVAEYHRKIKEAFEVFDHEANNTVDVREIGTIIRSLGCCPSEGELHDLIAEVEEEEPTGYIRYEKFLPVMTEVLLERRYRPIPEDTLLRAFEVLDSSKRGFLTREELIKYMTEEGEPFSQEEMEEMLSAAVDPESNSIHYKDYIAMMVVDES
ncbi:dynein regulatory complex protein 8 isoform X2 [Neovison vison]|uniref:dynein regulatory complex protein 8 isoform X2 n=1 Tax=Neovison vison TaxID=452646 RepID=UPI001CF003A9|nr:dynein regulatory complex protein 8 isoform X2 [Neogale vison]